ncbi:hypothetical protein FHX57_006412 [Paraburkholderia tropica]|uniref:hypothetical protein n=1 Tax=Paraburkholderia tropica TaxID=92647 RepID=UPI0016139FA1|nr:hypothetical protein [Paraburkholderia tropica]MBB2984315.1 hypothetical protein [Paraburkholderia tropica]MBB3004033.1 hypothetical protein [Paraburkholderia tropica]MBB6323190.1 hypothetical protein [Paraburkholderia tropica]
MEQLFVVPQSLNKRTARSMHAQMQELDASRYEVGLFYRGVLRQQIWPSQREMAKALGVSTSSVSRLIALASIPGEVVSALGSPNELSFRVGELVLGALRVSGERVVIERAKEAKRLGYPEVEERIEYIVSNRIPQQSVAKIRVRLARDKQSLRVEMPQLLRLMPHLSALEEWLSNSITFFEASVLSQVAVAAHDAREARRSPLGRTGLNGATEIGH